MKWKSVSLFLRSEKWNENLIHSFREVKSEMKMPWDRDREVKFLENSQEFTLFSREKRVKYEFTLFEKWKVKWFLVSLFSRSESEIKMPRDRDREVKLQNNSREFSRNETLAGYCQPEIRKRQSAVMH